MQVGAEVRCSPKRAPIIRLYMSEHCSLCFRVRMMAALKRLHLREIVVLNDDSDTVIAVIGRRIIPILVRDDGKPMLESMDMVRYVEEVTTHLR
jgi:glutaredoxin 2